MHTKNFIIFQIPILNERNS